jgi:endonuclease YncB( thermonuclease family)
MITARNRIFSLVFFFAFSSLMAECSKTTNVKVIGITDGDTIHVLDSTSGEYVIRLQGIDAPEHNQAFGNRSGQNLGAVVFGKTVRLECLKEESYNHRICKVLLPEGEDVCLDQVKAGLAWHYKQFQYEQSREDRDEYAKAEDAARAAHLGLWSDPSPIPPWTFRHGGGSRLCFDNADHRLACNANYRGPVRGNRRTHIYQWPGCPYYEAISPRNRLQFASAQEAEDLGYRPAHDCP